MAANNMMNLKVFLRDENTSEARRFTVDASVATSFLFMKEKLQTVYPTLRENDFKITWKDMDGDEITIASDEDFITAFTEMNGNVKVLYVTISQRNNQEPIFFAEAEVQDTPYHGPRAICDVCNQLITGFRYKCLQCPDYDLCTGCEHQGNHSDHLMMRVPSNNTYMPKCNRKFMHHVARSLKKSAYTASKDAYRAAKFASKFGPMGKPCGEETANKKSEDPQPSSSTQAPEGQGCPFSAGEAINMNDIHALGAMARQHLGPLLDVLQTPPQTAGTNADQGGLFMDMIRNAVDGFFGKIPDATPTGQDQPTQTPQPEKQTSSQNSEIPPTPQTPQTPQTQSVPMDIEGANVQPQEQDPNKKRDPGWTFVANNQGQTNTTGAVPTGQATAPTFVYHENSKIAEGLVQLYEMGFSNESGYLTHLLERFEGNVPAVVKAIVDMKL